MFYAPFTIDISGNWSPKQAQRVIKCLEPEANARGVTLQTIDITAMQGLACVLIGVFCKKHDQLILKDSACEICLAEDNP